MHKKATPVVKDLVLLGGGHAHLAVLRHFAMQPIDGLRLTVIARDVHIPYSGMLPGYIAGHYDYDKCHIDLAPLCRYANARLYHSEVTAINLDEKLIHVQDRPPINYDLCSINIGSTPSVQNVDGVSEHALIAKPIDLFLVQWNELLERVVNHQGVFDIAVIGGGAGGVELVLAVHHRLTRLIKQKKLNQVTLKCSLITRDASILINHNEGVRKHSVKELTSKNIRTYTDYNVSAINERAVLSDKHMNIAADAVIYVTHASAPEWPSRAGMSVDEEGFICVNPQLQSVSHAEIFAAGDIASLPEKKPKSGVYAVRQGKILAQNLYLAATKKKLQSYKAQKNSLSLIGTGSKKVIASYGQWSAKGYWLWRVKKFIDQRFVEKYNQLPAIKESQLAVDQDLIDKKTLADLSTLAMRCGGCGAKVGSTVLARVMQRLPYTSRDDVLVGRDSADDSAIITVPTGKALVQSVDYFRAFIDDPYLFGAIAANHALGDVFAMGAEAQSVLAIATVPYGREKIIEQTLYEVLAGANKTLEPTGAALIGGHSAEGAELAFGLTVNGLVSPDMALHKYGLQIGDALVLTKPLGTGTLFAADMRYRAKGRWIDNALQTMMQSNQHAVPLLHRYQVRACTDITGFGLLGHLLEMTKASQVNAEITLDALPILSGARETVAQGIVSSLHPQNLRLNRAICNNDEAVKRPDYSLLFDPQTAGGLLFGVSQIQASGCVAELHELGYRCAAVIGVVTALNESEAPIRIL